MIIVGGLAAVVHYVGAGTTAVIATAGISLSVVLLTFIALFTGVFGEQTAQKIIGLVLKGRAGDSNGGADGD